MNQAQGFDLIGWCDAEGAVLWGSSLEKNSRQCLSYRLRFGLPLRPAKDIEYALFYATDSRGC